MGGSLTSDHPPAEPSHLGWLAGYILSRTADRPCVAIGCDKCRKSEYFCEIESFPYGLRRVYSNAKQLEQICELDQVDTLELVRELVDIPAPELLSKGDREVPARDKLWYFDAVRWLVYECWSQLGKEAAEERLQELLVGTYSRKVLTAMQAHRERLVGKREAHELQRGQEQTERLRRKEAIQLAHQRRIAEQRTRGPSRAE